MVHKRQEDVPNQNEDVDIDDSQLRRNKEEIDGLNWRPNCNVHLEIKHTQMSLRSVPRSEATMAEVR